MLISLLRRITVIAVAVVTIYVSLLIATDGQPHYLPIINTSKTQYDVALAKWNSLHVAEYEETIQLVGCRLKSTVQISRDAKEEDAMGTVLMLAGTNLPVIANGQPRLLCNAMDSTTPFSAQGQLTVEDLFDRVNYVLSDQLEDLSSLNGISNWYNVDFDPDMGYPRHFEGSLSSIGSHVDGVVVESVNILKTYDQP